MNALPLSILDLVIAAVLVIALAATTIALKLGVGRSLIIATTRMAAQLLLMGLVLQALFARATLPWIALMALVMLLIAGREVTARQRRRLRGGWSYSVGVGSMMVSSFSVTVFALVAIIEVEPWYQPQYAIPILGMLLGNTMTGVAIASDRLIDGAVTRRGMIEARLTLGESGLEATRDIVRDSLRAGLIPTINSMAAAGVVSLPGMMTGQILSGTPPTEAVRYQILIWLLIAAGTGFGMVVAVSVTARRLFDERDRLRLDRLTAAAD